MGVFLCNLLVMPNYDIPLFSLLLILCSNCLFVSMTTNSASQLCVVPLYDSTSKYNGVKID